MIYGARPHDLAEPLMRAAKQLDNRAEMNEAGLQVTLPTVGIHLRIAGQSSVDHAAVIAFEDNLSPKFWVALKLALHKEVAGIRVPREPRVRPHLGGNASWFIPRQSDSADGA